MKFGFAVAWESSLSVGFLPSLEGARMKLLALSAMTSLTALLTVGSDRILYLKTANLGDYETMMTRVLVLIPGE